MWLLFAFIPPTLGVSVREWRQNLRNNLYDNLVSPMKAQDLGPTQLQVQIYVESLGNFQPTTMDYDLDIYFIQLWRDFRLAYEPDPKHDLMFNDKSLISELWQPDLYFANSKSAQTNMLTMPNLGFRVEPNGDVRYSMRVSLKVSCNMDLKKYPLDYQTCTLRILPYMNSEKSLVARWTDSEAVSVDPEIQASDLRLLSTTTSYCNGSYYGLKYSCLLVTFLLKRDLGSSLLQTYLPTVFIVVISWISFWIDPTSVPGRVALSVTTLLTLATQATGIQLSLPPVSYAKALDVWFGVCMIFLFGVLLEFAIVNMFQRTATDPFIKARAATSPSIMERGERGALTPLISPPDKNISLAQPESSRVFDSVVTGGSGVGGSGVRSDLSRKAVSIDTASRFMFPLAFFLFNCVYWYVYLA